MRAVIIEDSEGESAFIPIDNIAYIIRYEGMTRIYLRKVAGLVPGVLWYVLTPLSVADVAVRIYDEDGAP